MFIRKSVYWASTLRKTTCRQTSEILWIAKNEKVVRSILMHRNEFRIPNSSEITDYLIKHERLKPYKLAATVVAKTLKRYKESLKAHFEVVLKKKIVEAKLERKKNEDSTDAVIKVAVQNFPASFDDDLRNGDGIFKEIAKHKEVKDFELSALHVFMIIKYHLKTICAMHGHA